VIVMELTGGRLRGAIRRHPQILDAVLGLAVGVLAVIAIQVGPHDDAPRSLATGDILAIAAAFLAMTGRRLWPRPILVATAAVLGAFVIIQGNRQPVLEVALVIVAATLGASVDRRKAWIVAGGCALALFVVGGLWADRGWWSPENLSTVAWIGMATAVGDAARSRRAFINAIEERARRAEETREEEARRRVAEERMRIARELHDVVAHHIAVINVQAGAATHVLQTRPEQVGPALAHIRRASDTVLKELAAVVGVLRNSDDLDVATEPTRGLARLSDLLDTFAASGLKVEHRQHGQARELPAVVDLAAYRIVQEGLTNAQKHGTGAACLEVSYTQDAVLLDIGNAVAPGQSAAGSGYGLVGMRERASAAGGTVSAGAVDGGRFAVHAELPASPGAAS
jgi:signal transduction histidine kinase